MWHPADRCFAHAADEPATGEPTVTDAPPACPYCGAAEFTDPTDTGRGTRVTCAACGGSMVSVGGAWQRDSIGSPHNHPRDTPDPSTGGAAGAAAAPAVVKNTGDEHGKLAAVDGPDWCAFRHNARCNYPGDIAPGGTVLGIPQDRGPCPWTTRWQQQVCPISEAGPMALMERQGAQQKTAFSPPAPPEGAREEHGFNPDTYDQHPDRNHSLMPVRHAGFAGFVEAYPGHHEDMRAEDAHYNGSLPEQSQTDEVPVGHHTDLHNFAINHGTNFGLWHEKGEVQQVDLKHQPVYATQPNLVERHLNRYLGNKYDRGDYVHQYGENDLGDQYHGTHMPMFVKHEGNMFAIEGHHRTGAELMRGAKSVRGVVYDADKHGFPDDDWMNQEYESMGDGLQRHAAMLRADCDARIEDPNAARRHAVHNHDDGVCCSTEYYRGIRSSMHQYGSFARNTSLRMHMTATWSDVRDKAKRLRAEGNVHITAITREGVGGTVHGDHGTYEAIVTYIPGTYRVGSWQCDCSWATYAFERSPAFRRFEGRLCSHALSLQYEAQSRGMFGATPRPDESAPSWLREHRSAALRREQVEQVGHTSALDPDGVYATDHYLDLEHPPVYALALGMLGSGSDPAEALGTLTGWGLEHRQARALLSQALAEPLEHLAVQMTRCPACGALMADLGPGHRCPHCHTPLGEIEAHAAAEGPPRRKPHQVAPGYGFGGRMLMLQRSMKDDTDPAAGHWESTMSPVCVPFTVESSSTDEATTGTSIDDHRFGRVGMPLGTGDLSGVYRSRRGTGQNVCSECRDTEVTEPYTQPVETSLPSWASRISVVTSMVEDELGWDVSDGSKPYEAVRVVPPTFEGDTTIAIASSCPRPHMAFVSYAENDSREDACGQTVTHAGLLLKALDTGRILMIQRSLRDPDDPAKGTWEIPGGRLEPHDKTSLHGAVREFEEEIGHPVPPGGVVAHTWVSPSGTYQGHVVVVPSEEGIPLHEGRVVTNPDDPDGDDSEQAAWWHVEHARKNPALRAEVKDTPWAKLKKAGTLGKAADYSAYDMGPGDDPAHALRPAHSPSRNPGSTGFLTGQDPQSWEDPEDRRDDLGMPALMAELHGRPEPALPSTDGAPGSELDTLRQTSPSIPGVDDEDTPSQVHATLTAAQPPSTAETVARFQASAAARNYVAGPGDPDIARAAQAHLAAKEFTFAERQELITEGAGKARARNLDHLDIEGTHYAQLEEALRQVSDDPEDVFL